MRHFHDDNCLDFLLAELRWHTDDAGFKHRIVCTDHGFHFERRNILTTAPDGLFFSVDEKEISVKQCSFTGEGCSICMASASMMTEEIEGKATSKVLNQIQNFRDVMQSKDDAKTIEGDIEALTGVKNFPVRIKCALLPWTTLKDAIEAKNGVTK